MYNIPQSTHLANSYNFSSKKLTEIISVRAIINNKSD